MDAYLFPTAVEIAPGTEIPEPLYYTEGDGRYEIHSIPVGTWDVQVLADGFREVTKRVVMDRTGIGRMDFVLQPEPTPT